MSPTKPSSTQSTGAPARATANWSALIPLYFRSLSFLTGMVLSIPPFALISLLIYPLPFPLRYRLISQWARLNLWWLQMTCRLTYDVQGSENIPQTNSIVFCKHQSAWETLALQRIFPPQVWVLKRELLWIPLFGWGLAVLQPIAIDRKSGRKAIHDVLSQGRERLAAGRWVIVFPEGTRVAPWEQRRYGIGGALLAERTGFPVVPVAHNAGEFWPRRGFLKKPGVIKVRVGPPIAATGRRAQEINALAQRWIEQQMTEISAPRRTANPPHGTIRENAYKPDG